MANFARGEGGGGANSCKIFTGAEIKSVLLWGVPYPKVYDSIQHQSEHVHLCTPLNTRLIIIQTDSEWIQTHGHNCKINGLNLVFRALS